MDIPMDYTQLVNDLIRYEVGERKSDINKVKEAIRNEIVERRSDIQQVTDQTGEKRPAKLSLSTTDHAYIQEKYVGYCLKYWVQEVASFLKNNQHKLSSGNLSHDILQDLLDSLHTITNFKQIPEPFNQLQYYSLLMKHHGLIGSNNENTFIRKFKTICSEQIIASVAFVQPELDFLKAFVDFLLASRKIHKAIDELQLQSYCYGNLPFDELRDGIRNLEADANETEIIVLKDTTACFQSEKEPLLTKTLKEVIKTYIKPAELQEKTLDGRLVIEVTGKCIVMSKILPELERLILSNPDIEEVRIVGAVILHVDVDLKNEIWHGKNVFILVKRLNIHDKIAWDVSGKDNRHIYSLDAGTGENGHGQRGADGLAGESGGNISILTDEIKDPDGFTIISHGGRGGKGQNGGNGRDGDDGKGITGTEFKEKFPSVVLFLNDRLERGRLFYQTVDNIMTPSIKTTQAPLDNGDEFITVKTREGNEITFSYCSASLDTCLQSFLLYKGSLGKSGGRGGEYGLGGEGGYEGTITTSNTSIHVYANRGKVGKNGEGGSYGHHGKNAWDMGYADYQHWLRAKFYGMDQCSRLKLTYHDTSWGSAPKDSVWCPYHQKYAQITQTGEVEQRKEKKYNEQMNTRQDNTRQHQALATKKKIILQGKMMADYSHCYSAIEQNALKSSQVTLDNIMQRALQEIIENAEQQDKVRAEMKVRHVKSALQDRDMRRSRITAATSTGPSGNSNNMDIESLSKLLTSDGGLDGQYRLLKNAEFNYSELDQLISEFEKKKNSSFQNSGERNLEQILIKKYRFAMLREIADQLPGDHNVRNPMVIPESVSRYLIVAKQNENDISHPILGTLNQYLYRNKKEQREQVYKFFRDNIQNGADCESLKCSVGIFVLKVGRSEQSHPDVRKYYLEYQEFLKKQDRSLNVFLEPLCTELKRHKRLFALWMERNNNQLARIELSKKIRKNEFLSALYRCYNNQLKKAYPWTECCRDEGFLHEYRDHLCENGPLSECYRELLAHVFDVNIKLYYREKNNQFYMLDNHKPSSEQAIHVLKQGDQLRQLNIDEEYLRLEEGRAEEGLTYANILAKTKEFTKKEEFDDYLQSYRFSSDHASENDSHSSYGNRSEEYGNISEHGTEEIEDTGDEVLQRSIRAYILEVGESENAHPEVKKYYSEFKELSEKREQFLNTFFEPFHSELMRHEHVYSLWIASTTNESARSQLEEEMKKYDLLNGLHNRFDHQLKNFEYDWKKCCENAVVLKAHEKYVRENGPPSESQVELRYNHFTDQDCIQGDSYTHNVAGNESDYALETQLTCCSDNEISNNEYLVREEQNIKEIMKYFQSPDEKLQIKKRLEKITSQYTGQRGILHYLSNRFSNDGRHLSFQTLCYLVNFILTSVIQDRKELIIFCWIVAAYPQNSWVDELVLMQLENYFKKPFPDKSKWRKYLSKVKNKDILLSLASKLDQHKFNGRHSIQCIEEALNFLGEIPNEAINLEEVDLREWADALKEKYGTHELSKLCHWQESEDLSEASYYLLALENSFGPILVKELIDNLKNKNVSSKVLILVLSNFHTERWNLSTEILENLSSCPITRWIAEMEKTYIADQKERDLTQLVELIRKNVDTSDNITDQLSTIKNSLDSIRMEKPATVGPDKLKRFFNWFYGITNTSRGTSENLPAIKHSANPVSKSELFVKWIKSDDKTSEDTSNRSSEFVAPIEIIREEICATTAEIAGNMTEYDLKIHSHLFRECLDSYQAEGEKKKFIEQARIGMLAVIDRAIELKRQFKLRDTQKITILALLVNERNTLAQVSTGEGKSLIVVAASIMKAICREKVDIITSSSVLAQRDAERNRDIYSLFDISVSHNCSEDIEQRRGAYSSGQVVYGDLSNFQRDYLLDRFYEKNILGDRNFENVFIDEVDSMLLDKGNNMLYLSHDLPGLDKLESLHMYIWQWVNRPAKNREDFCSIFDIETIKESVLNDLYGVITKEDVKKLDSKLDIQQATIIWDRLIEAEVLDDQGKMLIENIDETQLEAVFSPKFDAYKNRLCYLLKESIHRIKMIHVPNYLKPFIEQHLEAWIKSAITATVMQEGYDYVMDADKTGTSQDMNPHVTIVDRDTGTYQANSQWDEALHQYLQLKHGCKLSMQSLKAVFISNVSYLKIYKNLYGVTGTLGSQRERDLLLEIHRVDFVTIPTAMPKQFTEKKPILCTEKEAWIDEIFSEAKEFTDKLKRSVLIICETINDAEDLYRNFEERGVRNIHTYTRDYNELDIAQGTKELGPGHIIIATNLCGRGTDIKITKELRNAGGLHVCLTYLPKNSRIEQQAFGRGARSGDKGSGRLIIMDSKGKEYKNLRILDFKKQRDAEESLRIPDMKAHYEAQIIPEEYCFHKFNSQYKILRENLTKKNVHIGAQKILMQSCLNKWAFWLDNNSKRLENLVDEEGETDLKNSLEEFILQLNNLADADSDTWVEGQPVQMVKLGKHFCQVGKYDDAIELFDKVIELEPCFSEAAHYYKAFALMKNIDFRNKPFFKQSLKEFKMELREAERLFKEHRRFSICAAGTIQMMKKHNQNSIIQIDTYEEQQKSFSNLYDIFLQSIDEIFDQPITTKSFVNVDINAELSETIYENLLRNGILKGPNVENNISEEVCNKISFEYGISFGDLQTCLSALQDGEMDEKEFKQTLKKGIQLPSREDFWKLLIQENIIGQEVKCIIIDVGKLHQVDHLFSRSLRNKIVKEELHQQTLEYNDPNEIILNPMQSDPQKDYIILEKSVLREVLANDDQKYEFLKKKGVFTSNRKARIDLTKIASSLPRYDSITLNDFSKENIAGSDAEKILTGLVEENILKKVNSENDIYQLVIPCSKIKLIQLPAYPIYRNAVVGLLSLCFTYRTSLEIIKEQLENKNIPTDKRLLSKPHHDLIYELIDHNIISPVTYKTKIKKLKQKLKTIYSRSLTRYDLESMLSESRLIPEIYNTHELYRHLVDKKWLIVDKGKPDVPETDRLYACLVAVNSVFDPLYYINDSVERQELTSFEDIKETIQRIFDDRLKLGAETTIEHIIRVLEQSMSPLNTLKNDESNFEPLTESKGLDGSRCTEEVNIFTLNGLDQILRIEGSKEWSVRTLTNAGIVILIGVTQIVAGIVINKVSSAFTIDHTLITEGINDIIFANQFLRSGHCSLMDYVQQKIRRLMLTVTNFCVRAFQRCANVPRFGFRVAPYALDICEPVAETTRTQQLENILARGVVMTGESQLILRTIDAATVDLDYGGVDVIIKNFLRTLCDDICSAFLSAIKKKIEDNNVLLRLDIIYQSLGKDGAVKLVADLTDSFFNETGLTEKYLPIASNTGRSVAQEIESAVENMRRSINTRYTSLAEDVNAVLARVPTAEDLVNVDNLRNITGSLMNNLEKQLMITVGDTKSEKSPGQNAVDRSRNEIRACENFKNESIERWHSLIAEKIGRIMERHIVRPILKKGAGCLMECCETMIERRYQLCRVGRNNERSSELAQQYQESQRSSFTSMSNHLSHVETYNLNEYHYNLNTLTTKISNHQLLAALVRENVPMDVTCLNACVKIISKISGIEGLTIIVTEENGMKRRFSFPVDGVAGMHVIQLKLINNRFLLHGSGASESNRNGERKNNNLYEAISGRLNLKLTRDEFRAEVANCIEHDPDVQHNNNQGLNSGFTSTTGGRREHIVLVDKLCTNPIDEEVRFSRRTTTNSEASVPTLERQLVKKRSRSAERPFSTKRQPIRRLSICK